MPRFDSDAESGDRRGEGRGPESFHGGNEAAGEAEAVKKAEPKCNEEARSHGRIVRAEEVEGCGDYDAQGDNRFDDRAGGRDQSLYRQAEGGRVRGGKSGGHGNDGPKPRDREDERNDEQDVIPSRRDMLQTVDEVIPRQRSNARSGRVASRRGTA